MSTSGGKHSRPLEANIIHFFNSAEGINRPGINQESASIQILSFFRIKDVDQIQTESNQHPHR
jgi:hypothetical protein